MAASQGPVKDFGVSFDPNPKFRKQMEDEHVLISPFGDMNTAFFAVYDGHAGKETATFVGEHLHRRVLQEISNGKRESVALAVAYDKVDKELLKANVAGDSGCTAVTALIRKRDDGRWLYMANCGDSRAILIRNNKATQLSKDHNPSDPQEAKLLEGKTFVVAGKVAGMLGVSRAFGDFQLKDYITVEPHIAKTQINNSGLILILACDGLWDVCTNDDIPPLIANVQGAQAQAEHLVKQALERGSKDNVSVVVVHL